MNHSNSKKQEFSHLPDVTKRERYRFEQRFTHPRSQHHCSQWLTVEATHVSKHRGWVNTCGLYVPWMLFSPKNEGDPVTCYIMSEPGGHYAQCNKPVTGGQALCDPTYLRPHSSQIIGSESGMVVARDSGEVHAEVFICCLFGLFVCF